MTVCIGINGFGRIGRAVLRRMLDADFHTDIEVVAINDLADAGTLAHLLAHDSTYGTLAVPVRAGASFIDVDGRTIGITSHTDPADIDWSAYGADLVIEATGRFRTRDDAARHFKGGARKVLISAPGKSVDATIIPGVNDDAYDARVHDVVSMASCTTNCVAPMIKVLHDDFGVVKGFMTTVHAYTGDQVLLDAPHTDLRRARSAAVNIVPTTTGAAHAVGQVLPELDGRLDGVALRVPVEDGSIIDLAAILSRPATKEQINMAFADAADGPMRGILRFSTAPLVSRDVIGDTASCVFDSPLTQAHGTLVRIFGWYDNERGYAGRLAELAERMGHSLP
ncbi:MAG TPA: type I glyceraldehyde-3-phosphate dehydrogenase [Thermopolyspora sp.]|jgi:glyceraldehyde-3-phosphate dehydrogenase, type I